MQHKSLGKYQIQGTLGKGSMGVIYIAFDTALERKVAIKTMTSELMTDPQLRKRFNTEAKAAGSLRHANIITIFELGEEQKTPYIVMELLNGTDLKTMMQSNQRWPYRKLLNIAIQTSKGLHFAHQNGVVHRDIKPANIFICSDGLVKILDFGVAHVLTSTMTQAGMLLGSLGYMPPEQIIGQKVDGRVDQYSLGVILYELITGAKPFLEKDIPTTIQAILNKPPIPIRAIRDDCPEALETAVLRSLQKDREKRYPNLDEFGRVLSQLYATVAADDTLQLQQTVTVEPAASPRTGEKKGSDTKSWLTLSELLNQSRALASDGRLTEAIGLLKEHHKTYQHDPEFQTYYRQLRQEKESFDKRAMFQKHYQDALRLLDEDNFQLARLELETLLKLDPSSPQISKLDRLISTRESTWQINEWAEEGEKLANRGSWDELAAHIEAGNRLFGKVKDYIARREHLENRREKSAIDSLFDQLVPLEESGRLEEAVALLRPLLRMYSKNRELVEKYNTLMATKLEQDRQESMQHFVSDQIKIVNTLLKSEQTEQAQIYLMKLLDKFPGTAPFEEKMIEVANQIELQQSFREIREALDARDLGKAEELYKLVTEAYPDEKQVTIFKHELDNLRLSFQNEDLLECSQSRLASAVNLASKGAYDKALEIIRELMAQNPEHTFLYTNYLKIKSDKETRDREELLSGLEELDRLEKNGELYQAAELALTLMDRFPNEDALITLSQALKKRLVSLQQEKIEKAIAAGSFQEAAALLDSTLSLKLMKDEPVFQELKDNLDMENRKEEHIKAEMEKARIALKEQRIDEALDIVNSLIPLSPASEELKEFLRDIVYRKTRSL